MAKAESRAENTRPVSTVSISMKRRTFLATTAALALPRIAHAECALTGWAAYFVTRPTATIPPDGGVLVALRSVPENESSTDPFGGDWSLVADSRRTRLRTTDIGPGLRRLDLPSSATGAIHVEGPIGSLDVTRGAALPPLEAPAVRRAFLSAGVPSLTLARPVPQGVIACVLRRHAGRTPVPSLRGRARAGTLALLLYEEGRCPAPLPGALVPSIGTNVDLVYVDAFGRLSPPSGAVRVEG